MNVCNNNFRIQYVLWHITGTNNNTHTYLYSHVLYTVRTDSVCPYVPTLYPYVPTPYVNTYRHYIVTYRHHISIRTDFISVHTDIIFLYLPILYPYIPTSYLYTYRLYVGTYRHYMSIRTDIISIHTRNSIGTVIMSTLKEQKHWTGLCTNMYSHRTRSTNSF